MTIPGSSRCVKFVPFHPKNMPKGRHFTYLEDPGMLMADGVFLRNFFSISRGLASILRYLRSSFWWVFSPTHFCEIWRKSNWIMFPLKYQGRNLKIYKRLNKNHPPSQVAHQKCPTDSVYGWEVQGMTQHDSLEGQVLLPTPVVNRTRWYPPLMKGCGFPTSRKALSCLCPPSCLPTKTTPPSEIRANIEGLLATCLSLNKALLNLSFWWG